MSNLTTKGPSSTKRIGLLTGYISKRPKKTDLVERELFQGVYETLIMLSFATDQVDGDFWHQLRHSLNLGFSRE